MIEPPETPHAGHRKSNINWFDVAMAIGVLAVSLGSLYVALHTGHTMEKLVEQNERLVHAQSTPILQFTTGNTNDDGEPEISGEVINVGSGAARVIWARFVHEDERFENWSSIVQRLIGGPIRSRFLTTELDKTMLSVGEERRLFAWPKPEEPDQALGWAKLNRERWRVTPEVCFCSLFNECWTSHMNAELPVLVESCEVPRPLKQTKAAH